MDKTDRLIMDVIQKAFPLDERPFRVIGEKLGLSEEDVLERVRSLKEQGVIRRIGGVFDAGRLGFSSTLCAARVPPERMAVFVETVNGFSNITHNYRRNHEYNIWFTVIAPDRNTIDDIISEIKGRTGVDDILDMPATRRYKIDAVFDFDGAGKGNNDKG